jgi:nucleoside-triphosphatase THEP1
MSTFSEHPHGPVGAPLEATIGWTRIAALPAEDSVRVQSLMQAFAEELIQRGVRVGGVTQTRVADASGRSGIMLRDVATAALYPISQDLGPGSVACNLDTGELALACAAIERAARGGAQLIVISKFSKQEAGRGGLCDAFRAAMAARVPVIAAVSPHYREEWRAFAGSLAEDVAPERQSLAEWWAQLAAGAPDRTSI